MPTKTTTSRSRAVTPRKAISSKRVTYTGKKKSLSAPDLDPGFWRSSIQRNIAPKEIIAKPYLYHGIVFSCVKAIAMNLCRLQHGLCEKKSRSKKIFDHPLLDKLSQPNPLMTEMSFWQLIVCNMMLQNAKKDSGGQCFIVPWNAAKDEKFDLTSGGIPDQLYPYTDEYFEPWIQKKGNTGLSIQLGWRFKIPNVESSQMFFKNEEIIRIHFVNPYEITKGMPPILAATISVDQDVNADLYNTRFFQNDARLAGLLTSEQPMTKDQMNLYMRSWYEEYGGPGNTNRTAILGNGLKYQQFALSHLDMQFTEQKNINKENIISAFGLNKIALGDYEQINLATIREGRRMLWTDTYIPIDEIIWDAFNNQFIKYVEGGKYHGFSDYSRVHALSYDNLDKLKVADQLVKNSQVPFTVACQLTNVPLADDIIKRFPYLDERPQLVTYKETVDTSQITPDTNKSLVGGIKQRGLVLDSKEARENYSNAYIKAVLEPGEKNNLRNLMKYFTSQRNKILDNVDNYFKKEKGIWIVRGNAFSVSDFIPDSVEELKILLGIETADAKKTAADEVKQINDELGSPISWNATDDFIDEFVAARKAMLKDINTATFSTAKDAISATVKEGIDQGWTNIELAKEIKKAVNMVYEVRLGNPVTPNGLFDLGGMSSSRTIARTEMGTIASLSRDAAFHDEKIKEGEWVTAKDDKVRISHAEIDGDTRNILKDETYANGLKFPRDPDGDIEEIINCFPGEMLLDSPSGIDKVFRSIFKGQLITIEMSPEHRLTGTPNHPVLTRRGWVPMNKINKGDEICKCVYGKRPGFGDLDIKAIVPSFEQLYNSLSVSCDNVRVARTDVNFYGDRPDSDVNIVNVNRELLNVLYSSLSQKLTELVFPKTDLGKGSLFSDGLLNFRFFEKFFGLGSDNIMSLCSDSGPCFAGSLGHSEKHCLTSVSTRDAVFNEPSPYNAPVNMESFGDSLFGFARKVITDDFRRVEHVSVTGVHSESFAEKEVYTIESLTGIYICNGVIVKNCRCVEIAHFKD